MLSLRHIEDTMTTDNNSIVSSSALGSSHYDSMTDAPPQPDGQGRGIIKPILLHPASILLQAAHADIQCIGLQSSGQFGEDASSTAVPSVLLPPSCSVCILQLHLMCWWTKLWLPKKQKPYAWPWTYAAEIQDSKKEKINDCRWWWTDWLEKKIIQIPIDNGLKI